MRARSANLPSGDRVPARLFLIGRMVGKVTPARPEARNHQVRFWCFFIFVIGGSAISAAMVTFRGGGLPLTAPRQALPQSFRKPIFLSAGAISGLDMNNFQISPVRWFSIITTAGAWFSPI